jgi:uncharacterized protein
LLVGPAQVNGVVVPAPLLEITTASSGRLAPVLLLAHGAGAPMDSPFMQTFAGLLAARGVTVVRFEFSYMAQRRLGGKRRPPPKMEVLVGDYMQAVLTACETFPRARFFIDGKSMGGRVASMVADAMFADGRISGCVCLGYPFHPVKQPEKLRTAHLAVLTCPAVIVQGERDALGNKAEVDAMGLSGMIEFVWLADGDHDFRPRATSGLNAGETLVLAAAAVAQFIKQQRPS